MQIKTLFVSVILSTILAGCAVPTEEALGDVAEAIDLDGGTGTDPGYNPPHDARLCPDETWKIENDTDINTDAVSLSGFDTKGAWIAWKYAPDADHIINKLCIASKPLTVPTRVYLLADASGAPGAVLKDGDLYNTTPGYACTLDAPFNFTGAVEAAHTYWIASNATAPLVASGGARIPFWSGDSDPGVGVTRWTQGCSAGFVAKLGVTR